MTPTVLLAEDDDDLRRAMEWTLNAMGYGVIACADAQLASQMFRSNGRIDVLLTDFEMPGKSGVELARELTSLCPTLPVIIHTGSTLSDEAVREIDQRDWMYLRKPCAFSLLQGTLHRVLNLRRVAAYKDRLSIPVDECGTPLYTRPAAQPTVNEVHPQSTVWR